MTAIGIEVEQGPLNKGKEMRGKEDKYEPQHTTFITYVAKFSCQMFNLFSRLFLTILTYIESKHSQEILSKIISICTLDTNLKGTLI